MRRNVFIPFTSDLYKRMFYTEKWEVVKNINDADLIQFTGGADVSPSFYGQKRHPKTISNILRDKREAMVFKFAKGRNIPMAGICRGAQFLNVMCGGGIWQDVDGHANGETHEILDLITDETFRATSTHHQMMDPTSDAIIVGVADKSTWRATVKKNGNVLQYKVKDIRDFDAEIVWYEDQSAICFQPHPEFVGVPDLKSRYFNYIEKYLFPSD